MKKLLILILLLSLTGCSQAPCSCDNNLGATTKTETEKIHDFEKLYKEIEKKHKHIKKYEIETGKYLVNEYVTPSGEVGYQIVKDDGEFTESICLGVECENKNYIIESIKVEDSIASSTNEEL